MTIKYPEVNKNYNYKELGLLTAALIIRHISFISKQCNDGWCIVGDNWDVAINCLTMGHEFGDLELLMWDEQNDINNNNGAYGCLSTSEVLEILENKGLIPKD